jgi:NTE family protein/lysophospholipid hydrolase
MTPTLTIDGMEALLGRDLLSDPLPEADLAELLAALQPLDVAPRDAVVRQGDRGDDLYVVLSGRLAVSVAHADGSSTPLDDVGPGAIVGEMALLTGQARTATVVAVEPSRLARLGRADFERLAARHPAALRGLLHRLLPRMRGNQLAALLAELFGPLDAVALREVEARLEWMHLASGKTLFRQGDAGEHVYVVVNGRLRVAGVDGDGRERTLEEVGRGGAVGEVALLTGEPRSASVYAVRDSYLLRLSRAAFDELLLLQPRAMMQIARAGVWRLRRAAQRQVTRGSSPAVYAVVAAGADVELAGFARRLAEFLGALGGVARLSSADVDRQLARPGIAGSGEDSVAHESLAAWLGAQERDHGALVLEADPEWTAWTRRCVRLADRVLIVARAGADPTPGAVERSLGGLGLKTRTELVLLHPDSTERPTGTLAWLTPRDVAAHHHVRLGNDGDMRRLARRVSGRATGLVLGGGGARGFAHIGTLRALDEAGIEVDMIGGTSIGSVIAAGRATGISLAEMLRLAEAFASPKQLLDRTLPVVAMMAGGKVTALYRRVFGELLIEDLWLPCFVVSSGLSRAAAVVHQRGPVWRAVRASTAIPAIFPPLLGDDGEVLIDGGVMNNMPLDVMRELCAEGTVIGVNPMPAQDRMKPYHFGPSLSGWRALLGRLRLFGVRTRAPSILGSVMRATEINSANRMRQPSFRALADLLLEPPVQGFPILAFDQYAPIIDIGYRTASAEISAWQAARAGAAAPRPPDPMQRQDAIRVEG